MKRKASFLAQPGLRLPAWILVASTVCVGQVTPGIRRISKEFQGTLPWLWVIEGAQPSGRGATPAILRSATLRLLDDAGKQRLAPIQVEVHPMDALHWQANLQPLPADLFRDLEPGSYIAEWRLDWEGPRIERVEVLLRIGAKGDGWLQRAFVDGEGGTLGWTVPSLWQPGQPLRIQSQDRARKTRYQLVREDSEEVLRVWTDLDPVQAPVWNLPSEAGWKVGGLNLWIAQEDSRGIQRVAAFPISYGGEMGTKPNKSSTHQPKKNSRAALAAPAVAAAAVPAAPSVQLESWLAQLSEPGGIPWNQTNRVATVSVGYTDETRTEGKLWPADAGRPMSLSLTGADGLGKPIYGVSYLLEQQAGPDAALETIAQNAASVSLPLGAEKLSIGGVLAPVVFTAGKIEDLLGKPLAAGYAWSPGSGSTPTSAKTWSGQPPQEPPVGVTAIRQAGEYREAVLAQIANTVGYSGEGASLTGRIPYALTLPSQDPLGRTILAKAIGSAKKQEVVQAVRESNTNLSTDFSSGIPRWLQTSGTSALSQGANPDLVLNPGRSFRSSIQGSAKFRNANDPDGSASTGGDLGFDERLLPGEAVVPLGRLLPQTTGNLSFLLSGPSKAEWILETGNGSASTLAITGSPASLPTISVPTDVSIRFTNTKTLNSGTPAESDKAHLDNLAISLTPPPVSLEVGSDWLQHPVVDGFTRTQYGVHGIYDAQQARITTVLHTVTMVTDPDGSAVAELKDLEGRTVLKIVNPDSLYINNFYDYQGQNLQPSQPKYRVATGTTAPNPTPDQRNLVTQYVFDTFGHLRLVIPPKGVITTWGYNQDNPGVIAACAWNGSIGAPANPIAFATYNAYDDSGHLIATYNPDEGLTRFRVDQKGRVQASQTQGQRDRAGGAVWTRTLYDQIFRVRAIGEVADNLLGDAEALAKEVVTDPSRTDYSGQLQGGFVSVNLYDDYGPDDPKSPGAPIAAAVKSLLPGPELWKAFPDGHLTRTLDPKAIERYYYDQDGRIVIRWVTFFPNDATRRKDFAIGIYYDFAGRVKRLIYPDGPGGTPLQVQYKYDDLGRLFTVGTPDDEAYFARYAYLPTGELKAIVYGPGEGFAAKRMLQDPQGWLRALTVQGKQ